MRVVILLLMASVLASGCSSKPPTAPTPPAAPAAGYAVTTVSFSSDPDDFVGRGRSMTFTLENSLFQASVANNGAYLSVVIRPKTGTTPVWTFLITSPNGSIISPGTSRSPTF